MQIVTREEDLFSEILEFWESGHEIGRFRDDEREGIIKASALYLIVCTVGEEGKFAIKPVKNLEDAESVGKRMLERRLERGCEVTFR